MKNTIFLLVFVFGCALNTTEPEVWTPPLDDCHYWGTCLTKLDVCTQFAEKWAARVAWDCGLGVYYTDRDIMIEDCCGSAPEYCDWYSLTPQSSVDSCVYDLEWFSCPDLLGGRLPQSCTT